MGCAPRRGCRPTGLDSLDQATRSVPTQPSGCSQWTPAFFRRPDGSYYETAIFITGGQWDYTSAYINSPPGSQAQVRTAQPRIEYDPVTRFVRRGQLHLNMETGEERIIEVEALGDSGFFLKTAGYGPWKEHIHGSWQGQLHLDGEYIADCWADESQDVLGQFRDTPIRVREGDASGYGIMESIITGGMAGARSERCFRPNGGLPRDHLGDAAHHPVSIDFSDRLSSWFATQIPGSSPVSIESLKPNPDGALG